MKSSLKLYVVLATIFCWSVCVSWGVLNLSIKEIRDLYRLEAKEVNQAFIDQAFNELVLGIYLDHYRGRLSKVFNRNELTLVYEILKKLTESQSVNELELYDLSVKIILKVLLKSILKWFEEHLN